MASEHTRHSSVVGSATGPMSTTAGASPAADVLATGTTPLGPATLVLQLGTLARVSSTEASVGNPVAPSLRHVVMVLYRFESGHRSSGVWPGIKVMVMFIVRHY